MNKKGFISIYGIMLLSICMGFTSMLYVKAKSIKVENEKLAYAELYAIYQIKQSIVINEEEEKILEDEEEVEEEVLDEEEIIVELNEFYYDNYKILITFEIDLYTIQIYDNGQLMIHSQLRLDSANNKIVNYDYL